jgi:SOS-response transcriptional repressor LexA
MRKPLTKHQHQTLQFLISFNSKKGYMPSLDEICKRFKLKSVSVASYRIKKLVEAGYIKRLKDVPRGIIIK